MQRFLTFVVEGKLKGERDSETLKETVIGVAVFDRNASYDPKSDPVVRVEARRLRSKLQEYYEGPGKEDSLFFDLPKGSYVPTWEVKEVAVTPIPLPTQKRKRPWLLLGLIAGIIIAIIVAWITWEFLRHRGVGTEQAVLPGAKIRSLAVLPFRNLTSDPKQDFLVQGLTDEIITELAKIKNLTVISRTSADAYRATTKSLPEIARELHVDAVVEGNVESSPSLIRVNAQLIRAATDSHMWAETFERNVGDLFDLQSEIAGNIAHQIGTTLTPTSSVSTNRQPTSGAAYEAYLRGRYFWNKRTLFDLEKSIVYYKRAIQLDPNYANAYAALGDTYVILSAYGGSSPADSLALARKAAEQALHLDNSLAQAHTVMAVVKLDQDWDWKGATEEFQHSLQLSPSYPTAHHWYSLHLSRLGRHKEAEAEIRRALELDPLSLIISTDAGEVFYCSRKPDEATVYLRRVLELDPNFAEAHLVLGKVYEEKKDYAKAAEEFTIADRLFGGAPNLWALQAHALALGGKRSEAAALTEKLVQASQHRYVSGVDVAIAYCGLKDCDHAISWLNKAFNERGKGLDIIGTDPLFNPCRSDPRFQSLLQRLHMGNASLPLNSKAALR